MTPLVLGSGEHLFSCIDAPELGYECTEHVPSREATRHPHEASGSREIVKVVNPVGDGRSPE